MRVWVRLEWEASERAMRQVVAQGEAPEWAKANRSHLRRKNRREKGRC
jgi:hypothetical protein